MKLFAIIPLLFFLSACSAAPAADQQPQATPTNLSFGGLMASMQATEEPMEPTQEPTPDAMLIAMSNQMTAQANNNAAALEVARLGVEQAGIDATAQAAGIGATQTLEASHATAVHDQGEQEIRLANATAAGLSAITSKQLADNDAARLELLRLQTVEDEQRGRITLVSILFVLAIVYGGIILVIWMGKARQREYELAVEYHAVKLPAMAPPIIAPLDGMTSTDHDTTPPGDPVKFSFLADYALGGGLLGTTTVETAGVYRRPGYPEVKEWMNKKHYLAPFDGPGGGIVLSQGTPDRWGGVEFCNEWLRLHPLPIAGNMPNDTAPTDMDMGNMDMIGGRGVGEATEQEQE